MGNLRIVSHSNEAFADRREAGRLLAGELKSLKGNEVIVLGILRGGIIVAQEIALTLSVELDIALSHKIGAPMNSELAVGAVSETGKIFINNQIASYTGVDKAYIQEEKKRQMVEIKRRRSLFRKIQPKLPVEGRVVIMTDDGVATGATMQAALWAARQEHPKKLIAALPVGPKDAIEGLMNDADEVICLKVPDSFIEVSQFYLRFEQIEDREILTILKEYNKKRNDLSMK